MLHIQSLGEAERGFRDAAARGSDILRCFVDQDVLALDAIATRLRDFYREEYRDVYDGRRAEVERTVRAAQGLYRRNVFPSMKVGWGTYPNNIGHIAFPGCFRCHDESHTAADGSVIRQDCDMCHTIM